MGSYDASILYKSYESESAFSGCVSGWRNIKMDCLYTPAISTLCPTKCTLSLDMFILY